MKGKIIASVLLLISFIAQPQSFTSSNLPIVLISTDGGYGIPDNSRILATMKIIFRGAGQRNYLADQNTPGYLNYNGRIEIEIRGSSSQASEKKQYGFSTLKADNINNNNVELLGMPAENDWILNGMVWDPGLIRDYLCFNLSRNIGEYASRAEYCEVIINGSYKGLYLLDEKIKPDDNRVDVLKIGSNDNSLPELSGGYITKADKTTGGDPVAWTMTSWYGGTVDYIHHFPKPEDVTPAQNSYINNYFNKLANAAQAGDVSLFNGYPAIIDIPSFIDYIIISELSSNADAYGYSTYFHKDRNGKLRAGPVWDSDLTFGNDLFLWNFDRSHTDVWQLSDGGNDGSRFWRDLFLNNQFRCYLSKRWNELIQPRQPLNLITIEAFIDQTVALISEAAARDYAKWGIAGSHTEGISALKAWLGERISWLTTNLGSYSGCSNVAVPSLVISRIMYNPPFSIWFPDDEELEFIEITNNGDQVVNLSGIYFAGTGLVYQFPYNSLIPPDTSFYIAANSSLFQSRYRFQPFDQFTRHISNNGQEIVLSDAFGNVIDYVHFTDSLPWPQADGNGFYLKLTGTDLDNNIPGSWIASNELLVSAEQIDQDDGIFLYPNPVKDILKISSERMISSIFVYDLSGRIVSVVNIDDIDYNLNMVSLPAGVYILKISIAGRTYPRKILRY